MNILNITATDPAGAIYNMANAVNKFTEHKSRVISFAKVKQYNFKDDIYTEDRLKIESPDEVLWLLENSDTLIFHKPQELEWDNFFIDFENKFFKRKITYNEITKGKQVIFQHHGEPYSKQNVFELSERYKSLKANKIIVVTPDLLNIKNSKYIPNCIPVNDFTYIPRLDGKNGYYPINGESNIRFLCQSPTPTCNKNMELFAAVCHKVKEKYPDTRQFLLYNIFQSECLRLKRLAYLGFDHFQGWYGLSSLEFMSMGIPVINGADDNCVKHINEFFNIDEKQLPFIIANDENGLQKSIENLLDKPGLRGHHGKKSRNFMETIWTEKYIADKLIEYILL